MSASRWTRTSWPTREALFYWKSEASSGYGALDDFGVHPLSLMQCLFGGVAGDRRSMAKPYPDRPTPEGGRRAVETYDIATCCFDARRRRVGALMASTARPGAARAASALQIFGSRGTIVYRPGADERVPALSRADGRPATQGFRTMLTAPVHAPYDRFIPAPGHGLGFNELKIIECHELLRAIRGEPARVVDFAKVWRSSAPFTRWRGAIARGSG